MEQDKELSERVYVISGGAGGIGSAIAKELTEVGARIVLTDFNEDALRRAATEIGAAAESLIIHAGDITDPGLGVDLAALAYNTFGRLDGGVSCAGVIAFSPLLELKEEQWDKTMSVNMKGTFFLLQGLAKAMVKRNVKSGGFITISATSANGPRPNNADYGVSKAGVEHLTRTFALELAPHNVRVNAISPGVIPTPMWERVDRDRGAILGLNEGELTRRMCDIIPMGRIGSTRDIAKAARFLLSDNAGFATGQVLTVDGGFNLANA